jgi:hypothetical protein
MRFIKDRSKLIEYGKNLLIGLLFLSSVFLLLKSVSTGTDSVLEDFGSLFGADTDKSSSGFTEAKAFITAAEPAFILATKEDGSHYAAKYASANREKLLSQFSSLLGEAIGSANGEKEITEAQWRNSLKESGVFFDYLHPQPLAAIARWLGTEISEGANPNFVRRLFLGGDDMGSLYLYYMSEDETGFFRSKTALNFSALSPLISELPIGNSAFAFELEDEYQNIDPYFIFSGEFAELRALSVSNPLIDDSVVSSLLSLFDMRKVSSYPESDGSMVFIDGKRSLRIDIAGKAVFSMAASDATKIVKKGDKLELLDCINAAGFIAQAGVGSLSGSAKPSLTGIISAKDPENCTLIFEYTIDGVPISLQNNQPAVKIELQDGAVTRVEMVFRSYSFSGGLLYPLSERLAAAIAVSGGEPVLRYEDRSSGVSSSWINY